MERKSIILILLTFIIICSLVFLIIYNTRTNLSPTELEECKTLTYNGEAKINLVFFSTQAEAKEYSNYLLGISPFNQNKESFNIYYIDTYNPECEIYQEKALLCYNKDMVKKASSCPNDFMIVIQKEDKKIRSSAYMNLVSINSKNPITVLVHEFGHVFVNLADEYTPAVLPKKSKNCVKDCEDFNVNDGCFKGCAKEEYQRSIENGIMRTLSTTNFGVFNEQLVLNQIKEIDPGSDLQITGKAIAEIDCSNQEHILIRGRYSEGEATIISKTIEQGCLDNLGSGDLEYVLTFKNDLAVEGKFNPNNVFTDNQDPEETQIQGQVYMSDKDFFMKIPIGNSKSIKIIEDGKTLIEINLNDLVTRSRPCKK